MEFSRLSANNLSIGYSSKNKKSILHEAINFTVGAGEFICLLGPNGAGKSTLLKTITAAHPSIEGYTLVGDVPLSHFQKKDLAQNIAVVLTDLVNVDNMTVWDLVSMGRFPYTNYWGVLTNDDKGFITRSLNMCGILDFKDRFLASLSDGERQKVMIAKALAQDTPIIILDEPTAFLDFPSKIEIVSILRRLSMEEGKSILMTTHDVELALQIADKLWLLNKEYGFTQGLPEDLVLSSTIDHFFNRDNIRFDRSSGKFVQKVKLNKSIHLWGSCPTILYWTKNALQKKGYATKDHVGYPGIFINKDSFVIYSKEMNTEWEGNTVEDMLSKMIELDL